MYFYIKDHVRKFSKYKKPPLQNESTGMEYVRGMLYHWL